VNSVLPVALTFDLDPDVFDESIGTTNSRSKLTWRCISDGIPRINNRLLPFRDAFGSSPQPTWFVRVDNQIGDIYGRPAFLLEHFSRVFAEVDNAGHEIAWHPHLYRAVSSGWEQETNDSVLASLMHAALHDMQSLGYRPVCARIGEAYGSVGIMRAFDQLGIQFDATAMAGRRRIDKERIIDWAPTPRDGYRPSHADHRIPGAPHFSVVEIPLSMLPVKAIYDQSAMSRYLDLSFHPESMVASLVNFIADAPYIMTVTHPSAVLSECRPARSHGLLSFELETLAVNLQAIVDAAKHYGRAIKFVTVAELGASVLRRLNG
jgi:hypothetical protein